MSQLQQALIDSRSAIADTNGRFMVAFARQDVTAIAELYTPDGEVLPPGSDPIRGHDDIAAFWRSAMDLGVRQVTLETAELEASADRAFEVGRYTLRGEGGAQLDRGKYMVVWRMQAGHWKLHRDIWNSSVPPTAA